MSAKLDFNDILIMPSTQTEIQSRSEIDPYYYELFEKYHLPIISAPMDTVVSKKNSAYFMDNGINICYPRNDVKEVDNGETWMSCLQFDSVSLKEFRKIIQSSTELKFNYFKKYYVCIDIANGHMIELCNAIKEAKEKFGDKIVIMAGNIANSKAYYILSYAGADYIRAGIGNGAGCTTTANVAVGYPMASLIKECYEASQNINGHRAKIVADGGMKSYSDIIKALALGADYVMIGSMFNKCLESCAPTYFKGLKINQNSKMANWLFDKGFKLKKKFRGMSTKEVQKDWGKAKLTTSEGVSRIHKVEYKLESWAENFVDYLKSAMSYSNARTLDEFIGKANIVEISPRAFDRFNK